MDIQKAREAFERRQAKALNVPYKGLKARFDENSRLFGARYNAGSINEKEWNLWLEAWQAKAQAVPAQLDVNSILHDIDCYFDNGLSNTERTANNLLQSIYEKLSGEVKAQEPAND